MSSMSSTVSTVSIAIGVIELLSATVSIIVGVVAVTSYSGHASVSTGFWALVFLVPGVLSIVAGKTKNVLALTVALFFNIVTTVVSTVAALVCISFWAILSHSGCNHQQYGFGCDTYHKIFAIVVTMTTLMVLLTITSFTGCIIGCAGTCCAPPQPVIIATVPTPQSTVIINSQSSSQSQMNYHPMIPQNTAGSMLQAYTGVPVQTFGFQKTSSPSVPTTDDQPLVDNIVL
ncbi:uncharacterized protein LOC114522910 [Dendronephthya gigantea]|uniref:uncharacterized protein LOC114522910 n=1 Tax=Dendronephthya gigantea TaxID=151771 RepID=UPI00106A7AEB|nr:uncharacterized protein LOC114522910 [Dendronephthya gigantea]